MRRMVVVLFCDVAGCSTAPDGPAWGAHATLSPGWSRIGGAAADAAVSPATWVPVVVAGLLQIDHADRHISDGSRLAPKTLAVGLSAGTDYARVEGRKHYPSDVLVGAAIGHFIGVVAGEAFLGVSPNRFVPTVSLSRHGGTVGFNSSF